METGDCIIDNNINDWLFVDDSVYTDDCNGNITVDLIHNLRKNDKLQSRWVNSGVPKWVANEYINKDKIIEIHASTYDSYQRGTIAKWVIDEFISEQHIY